MTLSKVSHIVVYRPYRVPATDPKQVALFSDVREAMSFNGSHGRYCSSIDLLKCDVPLTEHKLTALTMG